MERKGLPSRDTRVRAGAKPSVGGRPFKSLLRRSSVCRAVRSHRFWSSSVMALSVEKERGAMACCRHSGCAALLPAWATALSATYLTSPAHQAHWRAAERPQQPVQPER